jgi:hypothetical protein
VCSRDKAIDRIIEEDKVPFELLLKKAQDNGNTVAVTMSNGKFYIGYVLHIINPAFPTQFIQILPTKSGYRDAVDKSYHFENFYTEALDKIDRDFDSKFIQFQHVTNKIELIEEEQKDKPQKELAKELEDLTARSDLLEKELDEIALEADAFGIVLPVAEIVSINIFSEYIYSKYFAPPTDSETGELLDEPLESEPAQIVEPLPTKPPCEPTS